jgi:hypothetical protein
MVAVQQSRRIPEAKEMADELTVFIESFGEDIWMEHKMNKF